MLKKTYQTPYGEIHYWIQEIDKNFKWLVFLPGLTADHHLFDCQLAKLGEKYNCFVWDAPAHGLSRPFELKFSMDDLAEYLHSIFDIENIHMPVLVGQSLGGYISQVYMQNYPGEVSGFISIDSCPVQRKYYTDIELYLLKHTKRIYLSIPWKLLLRFGAKGCSKTEYGQNLMKQMMNSYDKIEYSLLADHGYQILAQAVEANKDYKISCPVLLLCGEKDSAGSSKNYNKRWTKQEKYPLVWVPGAGHNSNTDKTDFVNDKIENFMLSLLDLPQ